MNGQPYEMRVLQETRVGEVAELPKAGTPLEHAMAYDDAVRQLKNLVPEGRIAVVDETLGADDLITSFSFRRLA